MQNGLTGNKICTVEAILKNHPIVYKRDKGVVSQDRWSLVTDSVILICRKNLLPEMYVCSFKTCSSLMAVVSLDRPYYIFIALVDF